jgi:hypothetical protein
VRLHGGAQLEVKRLVAREQGQVAVGGGTRDDLDVAVPLQLGEGPRDVAADAPVQLPHPLVHVLPEVRELDGLLDPLLLEVLARLPAVAADRLVVEGQLLLEVRRGELLDQDGREVDRPPRRDPVGDEPVRHVEEGQVALEGRLGEPVAPVRPASVVDHHGQVVVQHQRERIHSCA